MKKLMNSPEALLTESLQGFARAHADLVTVCHQPRFVKRQQKSQQKVALISGGGAGHEPLHTGLVGKGMLDAACPGQIFTSPSPDQMLAAAEAVDTGEGVLFIVKNYAGDVMNFEMAAELWQGESASVVVADDIAIPVGKGIEPRGVAGTLIVEKIVGAAAEQGETLATCQALGMAVNANTASLGVALTSCTVPALGKPTFELAEDQIEMGVGIHGERGRETMAYRSAKQIVDDMMQALQQALSLSASHKVLLHINGLGGTPLMELYAVYELASVFLAQQGIQVVRSLVGNYTTSLDMAGCSITMTIMNDDWLAYWDAPVQTVNLSW